MASAILNCCRAPGPHSIVYDNLIVVPFSTFVFVYLRDLMGMKNSLSFD